MAIRLRCRNDRCNQRLRVQDEFARRAVTCPRCGTVQVVPAVDAAVPATNPFDFREAPRELVTVERPRGGVPVPLWVIGGLGLLFLLSVSTIAVLVGWFALRDNRGPLAHSKKPSSSAPLQPATVRPGEPATKPPEDRKLDVGDPQNGRLVEPAQTKPERREAKKNDLEAEGYFKPGPASAMLPFPPAPAAAGRMLGALPGLDSEMPQPDKAAILLGILVTLPSGRFIPTEASYQEMLRERQQPRQHGKAAFPTGPFPPRESIRAYDARRFTLLCADGRRLAARFLYTRSQDGTTLVGSQRQFIFGNGAPNPENTEKHAPIWEMVFDDRSRPFKIQFDNDEPVPVPDKEVPPQKTSLEVQPVPALNIPVPAPPIVIPPPSIPRVPPVAISSVTPARQVEQRKKADRPAENDFQKPDGDAGKPEIKTPFGTLTKVETTAELTLGLGLTTKTRPKNPANALAILYFEPSGSLTVENFNSADYVLVTRDGRKHTCLGMTDFLRQDLVLAFGKQTTNIPGGGPITTQLVFEVPKRAGECELAIAGKIIGRVKIPELQKEVPKRKGKRV